MPNDHSQPAAAHRPSWRVGCSSCTQLMTWPLNGRRRTACKCTRQQNLFLASSAKLLMSYSTECHGNAFSALTLLVGHKEEHLACKRCWCGYLSGVRCRLFAYGPADMLLSRNPIISSHQPHFNPDWFYLSGTGLPTLSWKRGHQIGVVVVHGNGKYWLTHVLEKRPSNGCSSSSWEWENSMAQLKVVQATENCCL